MGLSRQPETARPRTAPRVHRGRWAAAGLFLLAGLFHGMSQGSAMRTLSFLLSSTLYVGLALGWAVSIQHRVMEPKARRLLIASALLVALWMVLRVCKYRFVNTEDAQVLLWYLYYLPQLFAPTLVLLAALQLNRSAERPRSRGWYLLLVPALALFLGIVTNNAHELAFRFCPPLPREAAYIHGSLYYAAMGWMLVMTLAGAAVLLRACRVPSGRRGLWLPCAVFVLGALLSLLSFANVLRPFKVPEMISATFVATWESCIAIGLLPTNTNYGGFFSASTIAAQITDGEDRVVYSATTPLTLSAAQRAQARQGTVSLSEDIRLHSQRVRGGYIYWTDSAARLNRIRARLSETAGLLSEENELLRAENDARRQQSALEEQNRLYESLLPPVRSQMNGMSALLERLRPDEADFTRQLGLLCVYGAYVKRRCSLALMQEEDACTQELVLCLRESVGCLTDMGVLSALRPEGSAVMPKEAIVLAYDCFEAAVERALPTLTALLVTLRAGEAGLTLRLSLEGAAQPLEAGWGPERTLPRGLTWHLTVERQDETLFETLTITGEGGETGC